MIHPPTLAWLQLRKQSLRLLVAIAGVTFAVVLMLMQLGFQDIVIWSATQLHRRVITDLVVVHRDSVALQFVKPFPRRLLFQTLANPDVRAAIPIYLGVGSWRGPYNDAPRGIFAVGFPPEERVLDIPGVGERQELLKVPDRVFFDAQSRKEYGPVAEVVRSGGLVEAEVSGHQVTVAGIYDFGTNFFSDGNILVSDETFLRIFHRSGDQVELGLLRITPGANAESVRDALNASMPPPVHVVTRKEFIAVEERFWNDNTAVGFIFGFGAIMGFVVGAVIVYQILFADVTDHLSEYATLKAMGYSKLYIASVVVSEALILAFLGFVPGTGLSFWLFRVCRNATQLPMTLTSDLAVKVLVLTVVMCAISGAIAIRKVQQADPADVF